LTEAPVEWDCALGIDRALTDNLPYLPTSPMHPNLTPLPAILLRNLGRTSQLDELTHWLAPHDIPAERLRQRQNGKPYNVSLAPHGLDLTLQCINPDASEAEIQWGLHSLTLHTTASNPANHWTQPWPQGLDPEQARAADVVRLLATNPEEAMVTPTLACFAIDGMDGLSWALMAIFDPGSSKLQTLTLQRSGDWVASTVQQVAPSGADSIAAQPSS